MNWTQKVIESWADREGIVNSMSDLETWIKDLNAKTYVNIPGTLTIIIRS